jgi:hypothetical protein
MHVPEVGCRSELSCISHRSSDACSGPVSEAHSGDGPRNGLPGFQRHAMPVGGRESPSINILSKCLYLGELVSEILENGQIVMAGKDPGASDGLVGPRQCQHVSAPFLSDGCAPEDCVMRGPSWGGLARLEGPLRAPQKIWLRLSRYA